MNPDTIKALLGYPEVRQLIAYFKSEADKLNRLSMLDATPTENITPHIIGLKYARDAIHAMLAPLIEHVDNPVGVNPEEFVV